MPIRLGRSRYARDVKHVAVGVDGVARKVARVLAERNGIAEQVWPQEREDYMVVTRQAAPYISVYRRRGYRFQPLTLNVQPSGTVTGCSLSPDGEYLAAAHSGSPFLSLYKRNGNAYTKLPNPAILPTGAGRQCDFSPDGRHLIIGHVNAPFISLYKREGDVFTKYPNPKVTPGSYPDDCAMGGSFWMENINGNMDDGTYYAAVFDSAPNIRVGSRVLDGNFEHIPGHTLEAKGTRCAISRDGSVIVALQETKNGADTIQTLTIFNSITGMQGHASQNIPSWAMTVGDYIRGLALSPDAAFIVVGGNGVAQGIAIFKRTSLGSYALLQEIPDVPSATIFDCAISADGRYLALSHGIDPFISLYVRSGDTFTRLPDQLAAAEKPNLKVAFSK